MKYEFHVGDYVEDMDGRVGYVQDICDCNMCKERGFYELLVQYTDGYTEYISDCDCKRDFFGYKRIGQYDFTKKDEDKKGKIEPLPEEYTKSFPFFKLETGRLDMGRIDFGVMNKKINELVEAVNKLKEQSNKN